ncbi:MAG: HEAT repeat domain-containing protein, partial [Deltaproteobacteria bacterium]|nr:HEAT repeat domain-containing protein [Deltaproteobacteria bacterium]
ERGFTHIRNALDQQQKDITWTISSNGFYEGKNLLCKGNKGVATLARELFLRRIKQITFSRQVTLPEWKDLLKVLKYEPEELLGMGGVEKTLYKQGIHGIWVNEVRYEEIAKRATDLPYPFGEKRVSLTEDRPYRTAEGETSPTVDSAYTTREKGAVQVEDAFHLETTFEWLDEKIPVMPTGKTEEEPLEKLLLTLEKEENSTAYEALVRKIVVRATPLRDEKRWDELFPVLITFAYHSYLQPHRPEEQRNAASRGLTDLLSLNMVEYLVRRLCQPKEKDREAIQQTLLRTGEEGINHLISSLIDIEDIGARRQLFNTLLLFGDMARCEAERRLDDSMWFVVRQMVAILGEIASPQSVDGLKKAFLHPDPRVKKEVLKAMSNMPPQEALPVLLDALKGGDRTVRLQAVVSLGILGNPTATPHLIDIALKQWAFRSNIDIRKEAVNALGIIRDRRAVPALVKILKTTPWFGKRKMLGLRCMAVISLGRIGGEEALKAIDEMAKVSTDMLYSACVRALEGSKVNA